MFALKLLRITFYQRGIENFALIYLSSISFFMTLDVANILENLPIGLIGTRPFFNGREGRSYFKPVFELFDCI